MAFYNLYFIKAKVGQIETSCHINLVFFIDTINLIRKIGITNLLNPGITSFEGTD